MDELDDAREALIEQCAASDVSHGRPQPRHAIVSLRSELATNAARDHRNAAREFAAWWADVATIAVLAAVTGQHVHPARVVRPTRPSGSTTKIWGICPMLPKAQVS
jgi:hypothetical protein